MKRNTTALSDSPGGSIRNSALTGRAFGFFFLSLLLAACDDSRSANDTAMSSYSNSASIAPIAETSPEPAAAESEWNYSEDEDAMTGKKTKFAINTSTNTILLGAPYEGAQNGHLTIRNHPQYGHDVIIAIEQGQLLCDISEGCTVLVRFDDDAPQKFSAVEPADNSSESLFIQNYSRFVARLKTAKRVRIQLSVYDNGNQMLEFNTEKFDASKL